MTTLFGPFGDAAVGLATAICNIVVTAISLFPF